MGIDSASLPSVSSETRAAEHRNAVDTVWHLDDLLVGVAAHMGADDVHALRVSTASDSKPWMSSA